MNAHAHYQKRSVQLHNLRRQVEAVSVPAWLYIGKMYLMYIIEKELHELGLLMSAGIVQVGFVPDATNDTSLTDSEWKVAAGLFRAEGIRLTEENERLRAVIDEYAAADKKQRAALAKYADHDNWRPNPNDTYGWVDHFLPTDDGWEIAEEAIKEASNDRDS